MTRQQLESQAREWARVLAGLHDRACQQVRRWDVLITSASDDRKARFTYLHADPGRRTLLQSLVFFT